MARVARLKDDVGIYHVMARSISEFDMFKCDEDNEKFLDILMREKEKFAFKVYAYCLMTNHYHIHIDPCGVDISRMMQAINVSYVRYINRKYKRKGPLLDGRFNSKLIKSDRNNIAVSAYIHLNPKDILEYKDKEFEYPYSSMGIYLGRKKDDRGLVDTDFVLGCIDKNDKASAVKSYVEFVLGRKALKEDGDVKLQEYDEEIEDTKYEKDSSRYVIYRDKDPRRVIDYVAQKFGVEHLDSRMNKWEHGEITFRSVCAHVLLVYCGLTYRQISKIMCNLTVSGIRGLCKKGFSLIKEGRVSSDLLEGMANI